MFSQRTGWPRHTASLTQAVAARRKRGDPLADLTASNPTHCGLAAAPAHLLAPLGDERALVYEPEPFGLLHVREAVCAYYRDHGAVVGPAQVCLTTSTSEAYSFLFRLLCDPGDEILIAQPSYPLFDFLADLDDVRLVPYRLFYDHGWQTVPGAVRAALTPRTRALVVVHPNNPTGHYLSPADRVELNQLCIEHELALIVDEVFLDYSLGATGTTFAKPEGETPLTFVLSGLSKVAALPQMKAAWLVGCGPEKLLAEALARLELIADTFLSMSAPIQHALPAWLAGRAAIQQQISARTRGNLDALDRELTSSAMVQRLHVEAGWYAVLRVPALGPDETLVSTLVEQWGVLVHPGYYYGFVGDGWLVVSLLPEPEEFAAGVQRLLACCAAGL